MVDTMSAMCYNDFIDTVSMRAMKKMEDLVRKPYQRSPSPWIESVCSAKAANVTLTDEETAALEKLAGSLQINAIRFWEKEMK